MTVDLLTLGVCTLLALLAGVGFGLGLGHWIALRSFRISASDPRLLRVPHRVGGDYYYAVGQEEYARMNAALDATDETPGWP